MLVSLEIVNSGVCQGDTQIFTGTVLRDKPNGCNISNKEFGYRNMIFHKIDHLLKLNIRYLVGGTPVRRRSHLEAGSADAISQ